MKKYLALALVCVATLSACSKSNVQTKQSSTSSSTQQSSTSSSTKQQSSTSSSQVKKDDKELYQSVFSDYQTIIDFANSADKENVEKMMAVLQGLQLPMNSWVMESAVKTAPHLRYAFYDLNQDGQNELFIGSENTDESVFVKGFYAIIDGQISLLAENFVAGVGGGRSALVLFQSGEYVSYGWSSGTGDAVGTLNKLDANGQLIEGVAQDFHMRDELVSVFGKTESEILDPNQFDWEYFEFDMVETETSSSDQTDGVQSMNLEQILAGNFSSLEGEWVNGRGDRIEIDSQGNVAVNGEGNTVFVDVQNAKFEGEVLLAGITNPNAMSSPTIPTLLIPKGVQNTYGFLEGHSDQTDTSKDRIFTTQSVATTESFSQGVFYRVDD
ncbi:DUF6287 domain-containing protein [Streptococcus iners]|uniref:DUF6287 domain-containing protein n=1 Tax=Streptococcus iners subsp. hyiners TaxID=3028083 RepID=A0AA96VH35_9STRE|nr:DUF6287 domain-containing protein [Streptococcus sp. 29892]MCK4030191.1 hypothetical protein [Streptococcus suis]WNY48897.1 DUF6287 domain-containing protein [Streptococcus sp. 29892]